MAKRNRQKREVSPAPPRQTRSRAKGLPRAARSSHSPDPTESSERKVHRHQALSTSHEKEGTGTTQADVANNAGFEIHLDHANDNVSPSRSAVSLSSEDKVQRLVPELLLENLPDLDRFSSRVIDLVAPVHSTPPVIKDLQHSLSDTTGLARLTFDQRTGVFAAIRDTFGSKGFLRPDLILRAILQTPRADFSSSPWSPQDIIFKANLATLILRLDKIVLDDSAADLILQSLDSNFPVHFLQSLETEEDATGKVGESTLYDATKLVALELRTQRALSRIASRQDPTPLDALAGIFLETDNNKVETSKICNDPTRIRAWTSPAIASIDKQSSVEYFRRYRRLAEQFESANQHDTEDIIHKLANEFNFRDFHVQVLEWTSRRHDEIVQSISKHGGSTLIIEQLQVQKDRRNQLPKPRRVDPGLLRERASTGAATSASRSAMELLKRLPTQARLLSSRSTSVNGSAAVRGSPATLIQKDADDSGSELFVPIQDGGRDMQRRIREKRRLVDRQDGAEKVQWSQDAEQVEASGRQSTAAGAVASSSRNTASPGKRRRGNNDAGKTIEVDSTDEAGNYEPSQDVGFQTDSRSRPPPVRTARPVLRPEPDVAYYASVDDDNEDENERAQPAVPHEPMEVLEVEVSAEMRTQLTRANADQASVTASGASGQDGRLPWTVEEDKQLIRYIGRLGAQWAKIYSYDKGHCHFFINRKNGTSLRDRAQQLKMDMLISGKDLPEGFEDEIIRLTKFQVERIKRMGGTCDYVPRERSPAYRLKADGTAEDG